MTEAYHHTEKTVLVALDIAKQTHDALIALPNGKTLSMRVPNTLEGYQCLLDRARKAGHSIQVAFEPTADYHRNIAYWLQTNGCECFLVSSLSCARAREMLF